jgi:polygalacturonase
MTHIVRRDFLKAAGAVALTSPSSFFPLRAMEKPAQPKAVLGRNTFSVRDFGATGDGKSKDTAAIQQAIDRCHVMGGGEVLIPAGNYLTGAIQLRSRTTLRLDHDASLLGSPDFADYPVTQVRWEGKWIAGHIGLVYAIDAENIAITGNGKIAGNPALGGRPNAQNPLRHPALIEPVACRNVLLDGFSTSYEHMWSIHPTYCEDVTVRNLTIRSTGGNGDGIDVDSCKRVLIDGCDISTGDDCISLKSGRGSEGHSLMRTTEDVRITNCTFADSLFACIGIGSETSGGIRNVRIENCHFTHARSYAIYIKSRIGRGAFLENIVAENLDISGMEGGFLHINLLSSGLQDQTPVSGDEGIPAARNFRFSNIRAKDVPTLVNATEISAAKPLEGFTLESVTGTCMKGVFLANAKQVKIRRIDVAGHAGQLLNISA